MTRVPSQHIFEKIIEDQSKNSLLENNLRGIFAEYLVVDILGGGWCVRDGSWNEWDIDGPNGEKLEVKSSALIQSWCHYNMPEGEYRISKPVFDIAEKLSDSGRSNRGNVRKRYADLYVFCLHSERELGIADHRIPEQWQFFVVRTTQLPQNQKTISLAPLQKLTKPVSCFNLLEEVEKKIKK